MPKTTPSFIHLRVHSAFSLAEGAIRLEQLPGLCHDFGMPAVAVTDTGNMFGALQFCTKAAKAGIQPIVGCQMWVEKPEQAADKNKQSGMPDQLVLLAKNESGYQNLMKLSSKAFVTPLEYCDKPAVSWDDIAAHAEGLICLTGGARGAIGRLLFEKQDEQAGQTLLRLKESFGDGLYIELERHGLSEEADIENRLLDMAYAHDIPIVATNNCFYAEPDMYEAHDALLCIAEGAYVQDTMRRRVTPEHYFKTPAQMATLFKDLPEAIENTVHIARRCAFMVHERKPILPHFEISEGESEEEEIRIVAERGLGWRLENYVFIGDGWDDAKKVQAREDYGARLKHELDIIIRMGFPGYFLINADFIQWAKDHGIPVGPGRGSGAGSLVAWALKITDLDPIANNLLFERFLNPERVSMPDFDIDFCQERRDEVIHYVCEKYGHESVAQIITFGKLQARAVVRDVGRVLQMPYGQVDRVAKLVPQNPANPISLQEALDSEPDLRAVRDGDEQVGRLIEIALKLEGLYRHASTHAAGVVIGDRPLDELVPLYRDPGSDIPATQFNMKDVENAGLVKFDFLGLKTLTVIRDAIAHVKTTTGTDLDPLKFPLDDRDTYALLARGECASVFQLESAGMRDLCKKMQVKNFEEISAIVALFRPGPMDNIPLYLENLKSEEAIEYMHPLLEPILKDTYGVMIYQEQVMQAAQSLAGYTLGGADLLRRAMGKKIQAEMDKQREVFIKGCKEHNDIDKDLASAIFDQVNKFAGYGFNKAHSAAYAYVAFQTAYLKAHYPVEFMAATMTWDMGNTDKLAMLKNELQNMSIDLLPPDINISSPSFAVEVREDGTKAIRYALAALKGVGLDAMRALTQERTENGTFKDMYDLARRLNTKVMNKRQMEALATAGAFDSLSANRASAHGSVEVLLRYASACTAEKESGQESLFGETGDTALPEPPLAQVAPWEPLERLRHEFDAVGFYLSAHPLDSMAPQLERLKVVPSNKVAEKLRHSKSGRIKMAGIVVRKQERTSQKGNRFAFVQVSDPSGVFELTLFSDVLSQAREYLDAGTPVLITAEAEVKDENEIRYLAQTIDPLTDAVQNVTHGLVMTIDKPESVPHIKSVLDSCSQGRMRATVEIDVGQGRTVVLNLPGRWELKDDVPRQLRGITGVSTVTEI